MTIETCDRETLDTLRARPAFALLRKIIEKSLAASKSPDLQDEVEDLCATLLQRFVLGKDSTLPDSMVLVVAVASLTAYASILNGSDDDVGVTVTKKEKNNGWN